MDYGVEGQRFDSQVSQNLQKYWVQSTKRKIDNVPIFYQKWLQTFFPMKQPKFFCANSNSIVSNEVDPRKFKQISELLFVSNKLSKTASLSKLRFHRKRDLRNERNKTEAHL